MIELVLALGGMGVSTAIGAGVFYKLGRLEQKLDFIYNNCEITVKFKNGKLFKKD